MGDGVFQQPARVEFAGFPRKVRYTPVPNPMFGGWLERIDDMAELKCTLRVIWLLHQKRSYPRFVTRREVLADGVLVRALAPDGADPQPEIERALALAVRRGTLLSGTSKGSGTSERVYALNSESDRRALAGVLSAPRSGGEALGQGPVEEVPEKPNIFALYEDNIGLLSPMIAEELKQAEEAYPQSWIEDAFREAVGNNKRSWRYIVAILERWEREGLTDGRPIRYPKKDSFQNSVGR